MLQQRAKAMTQTRGYIYWMISWVLYLVILLTQSSNTLLKPKLERAEHIQYTNYASVLGKTQH